MKRLVFAVAVAISIFGAAQLAQAGESTSAALQAKLQEFAKRSGGTLAVSIVDLDSGAELGVNASSQLPLYSVYKLPIAVTVLRHVQEGKLTLNQVTTVTAQEVAPGTPANTERWAKGDVPATIQELMELSIMESDNTASDKLLELAGGPEKVNAELKSMGFHNIHVDANVKTMVASSKTMNTGTASQITALLSAIYNGKVLKEETRKFLLDTMEKTRTGTNRLRAGAAEGVKTFNKTGTGPDGKAVHDVGILELPGNGHLAIAVLSYESKLPVAQQEETMADIARATVAWKMDKH